MLKRIHPNTVTLNTKVEAYPSGKAFNKIKVITKG